MKHGGNEQNPSASAPTPFNWSAPMNTVGIEWYGHGATTDAPTSAPHAQTSTPATPGNSYTPAPQAATTTCPPAVAHRPQVFVTLTAPSYGAVHTTTKSRDKDQQVCRGHRRIGGYRRCPHGKPLWCSTTHDHDDPHVGQPLCRECYDYAGHVLFTWHLPELWRRFTIALRRALRKELKAATCDLDTVRVSFIKIVELQARAIPHIHALIRLDPTTIPIRPSGNHRLAQQTSPASFSTPPAP